MAIVVMLLEDVALGAKIETRGRLVSARNNTKAFCVLTGQREVKGLVPEEPAVEKDRHIHTHRHTSFSVKQQLDGCTAAVMNPIEGEQRPGGQAFRGGRKAISPVPTFVCVCLCVCASAWVYDAHAPVRVKRGSVRELNCVWH